MRKGEYKIRVNIRFAPTSSVLNPVGANLVFTHILCSLVS